MVGAHSELRVSFTTLQVNKPWCEPTPRWHCDGWLSQQGSRYPSRQLARPVQINTLWMLSDFSTENGGTLIVPGSHARGPMEQPQWWPGVAASQPRTDALHVAAPAGSVCIFDCRLWHCLPPNRTALPRVMYNVRFFPHWVPVDLLCNNGYQSNQPPWPLMPSAVFAELPGNVRWLYEHAPLAPPAPTRPGGGKHCVDALLPEYCGSVPASEADAAEWVGSLKMPSCTHGNG